MFLPSNMGVSWFAGFNLPLNQSNDFLQIHGFLALNRKIFLGSNQQDGFEMRVPAGFECLFAPRSQSYVKNTGVVELATFPV